MMNIAPQTEEHSTLPPDPPFLLQVTPAALGKMRQETKDRIVGLLDDPSGRLAWPFSHYEPMILDGRLQLWVFGRGRDLMAAMLTELVTEPDGLWGIVRYISGHSRDRWQHLIAGLDDWFRARGCVGARCTARRGWERIMPDWRKVAIVMEKRFG